MAGGCGLNIVGMISAKAAFIAYGALAALAILTLNGDHRLYALAALALFAVKTYVDILRRRIAAREEAEAAAAASDVIPATAPSDDVRSGSES
jgi:hypothetical protein